MSLRPLIVLLTVTVVAGCGGRKQPQDRAEASKRNLENSPDSSSAPSEKAKAGSARTASQRQGVTSRAGSAERTWDNFPLNTVFFEDPGSLIGEGPSIVASNDPPPEEAATVDSPAGPVVAATTPDRSAASSPLNWQELLPDADLNAEVDEIRGRLGDSMSRLETFNGRYREIRVDAAVLAVLAGIAAIADSDVPWNRQAVHVRDVAAQLARSADGLGPANYRPAQECYAKLEALLHATSGKVEGLDPNPVVDMPWINVADLRRLMQRMNLALEIRIKEATVDAAELRKNAQLVRHEAAVLAALAAVIATSYDGSEDEEYQAHAARLKQEALALRDAVAQGDFDTTSQHAAAVARSCKDCHDGYRFGDDF